MATVENDEIDENDDCRMRKMKKSTKENTTERRDEPGSSLPPWTGEHKRRKAQVPHKGILYVHIIYRRMEL